MTRFPALPALRTTAATLFAVALFSVASAAPAAADSPVLDRVRAAKALKVGITGAQPPLNATSKEGKIVGFEADLANMLATSMGVKAELVATPFPQLLPKVAKGEIDIVISGVTITPERNLDVSFVGPYFISGKSILTKSKTMSELQDAREINKADIRLVALRDSTSQIFVEEIISKAKLTTVDSYEEGRKMVMDGSVDAMIADHPFCLISVLRDETEELVTLAEPFTFEPIGFALPPNDAQFVNLVQNFLITLEGTGTLLEMKEQYFTDGSWLDDTN
jgi:polar amino acid transport system substrate-binding protein